MEEYLPLIIQLISGAVGGNVAGKLLKNLDLGPIGNSIAGLLGGGLGGQLLGVLGVGTSTDTGALNVASILTSVAGGGVGGGVLMAIVGALKKSMAR